MTRTLQMKTTVLPGHRIELSTPELPEGQSATVWIVLDEAVPKRRLDEVLADYKGKFSFHSAEEVDAYLQAERDAWGR